MGDGRKPLTPKEIAMRSRKARKGGMARKKNLGRESLIIKNYPPKTEADKYVTAKYHKYN